MDVVRQHLKFASNLAFQMVGPFKVSTLINESHPDKLRKPFSKIHVSILVIESSIEWHHHYDSMSSLALQLIVLKTFELNEFRHRPTVSSGGAGARLWPLHDDHGHDLRHVARNIEIREEHPHPSESDE